MVCLRVVVRVFFDWVRMLLGDVGSNELCTLYLTIPKYSCKSLRSVGVGGGEVAIVCPLCSPNIAQ